MSQSCEICGEPLDLRVSGRGLRLCPICKKDRESITILKLKKQINGY